MVEYIRLDDKRIVDREAIIGDYGRILFIGEVHEQEWLVSEVALLLELAHRAGKADFLAMEHFNIEQQPIIDKWYRGELSFKELIDEYKKGPEGFDLNVYRPLLETAKRRGVKIIGIMPPRDKAQVISRTGSMPELPQGALDPRNMDKEYLTMLSKLFPREGPMAYIPVERLLLAQSYKDSIAAWRISKEVMEGGNGLVLMGWAHVEVKGAVATRVSQMLGISKPTYRVLGARSDDALDFYDENSGLLETDYLLVNR